MLTVLVATAAMVALASEEYAVLAVLTVLTDNWPGQETVGFLVRVRVPDNALDGRPKGVKPFL